MALPAVQDINAAQSMAHAELNSKEERGQPLRQVLQQHILLSRQVSQALFASIQSSFSTSLPPDPIPRPANLAKELANLPIWSLPLNVSPTTNELIPTLTAIHDSLDELLLKARTHRENARRIKALKADVIQLQSARRDRIKKLRSAAVQLKDIVQTGKQESDRIHRARQSPLNYADVLAYAGDLARNTSAPPGWSGSNRLLRQGVSEALKSEGEEQGLNIQEDPAKTAAADSKDTPGTTRSNQAESTGAPGTPADPTVTFKTDTEENPTTTEPQEERRAPFANPEEAGPSATSAPHSLPFPSDADMRRGLLGIAMLEQQGQADFSALMPTYGQWVKQMSDQVGQQTQGMDIGSQQQQEQQSSTAQASTKVGYSQAPQEEEMEDGFGLDLN
ncbi:unnamed protein product [Sympodiomycopsis kandeliae]